ncbi:MAG: hypothetical protein HY619_03310 [Thaumarchaeota archaeon]|nr:hypothetical protein [Nitrososphaerota archaeon]
MAACAKCGQRLKISEDSISIGERDLHYHVACAPNDLLQDVITEANAIVSRGIKYFVDKYLPNKLRASSWPKMREKIPTDDELTGYTELFARLIKDCRAESDRRKKKQTDHK